MVDQWYDTGNSGGSFGRQEVASEVAETTRWTPAQTGGPASKATEKRPLPFVCVHLALPLGHNRALIFRDNKQFARIIFDVTRCRTGGPSIVAIVVDNAVTALKDGCEMEEPHGSMV